MTARYVQLPIFEALTGYSQKAIRRKIEEGVWLEGHEFRRAPDGHVLVDMEGFEPSGTGVEGNLGANKSMGCEFITPCITPLMP